MSSSRLPGEEERLSSLGPSPELYVVDRETGEQLEVTVWAKRVVRAPDSRAGTGVERPVTEDQWRTRALENDDRNQHVAIAERDEDHDGTPQDVE